MSYFSTVDVLDASGVPQTIGFRTGSPQSAPMAIVTEENKSVTATTDNGKQRLDVQVKGEVSIGITPESVSLEVKYNKAFVAVNTNEWQDVAEYTVPAGYKFTANAFRAHSETSGESARVFIEYQGGAFDNLTDTFTDGSAVPAPQFGSGVYVKVTTQTSSGGAVNDIITITYTNETGVTGRTCTILIPKTSLVGTSIEGVLEGNDLGVRDITNVTHSKIGTSGAFDLDIYYNVFNLLMDQSNVMYQAVSIDGTPAVFNAGDDVVMAVLAGTKTSYIRHLSLVGNLEVVT